MHSSPIQMLVNEVSDIAQSDLVNSRTFKHLSCFQVLSRT